MVGPMKVNFDRASFRNPSPAGNGFVMRDSQGCVILVKGGPLGRGDAIQAKVVGLLEGRRMLKMKNLFELLGGKGRGEDLGG